MRDAELLRRAKEMRANPTPPEARLWYHLRAKRFEATKFRFQTVIAPYIIDFTSRATMLAIELDGDTHAAQIDYDARRDHFLASKGFRVLRFTNSEVMTNIEGVLARISEAISSSPSLRLRGSSDRSCPRHDLNSAGRCSPDEGGRAQRSAGEGHTAQAAHLRK